MKNHLENWSLRKRPGIHGFSLRILWQDNYPITYERTTTFEFSVQLGFWYLEFMNTKPTKKK